MIKPNKMKNVELIKETKATGDVHYSIEVNGVYLSGTSTMNQATADSYYEAVVLRGTIETIKETIKSIVLDEN
jgi:hypothetical protein